ncbi:hypothetical protein E4U56_006756 [Claviceps arundinis]|uniref:Uncharacterized protein n=1 Tax=Claviceps arundinis TaxID=1623583 RepID=A0A9P7MWV2_9HYPO|nr:hypothetical protein E4U56_006756 [Claviceps arundinis]
MHIDGLHPEDAEKPWEVLQYANHVSASGSWESKSAILENRYVTWAWTIRKEYDEKKACAKAAEEQGDTCVPNIHPNDAPVFTSTSVRF